MSIPNQCMICKCDVDLGVPHHCASALAHRIDVQEDKIYHLSEAIKTKEEKLDTVNMEQLAKKFREFAIKQKEEIDKCVSEKRLKGKDKEQTEKILKDLDKTRENE